jgi:hypothetical protein
MNSSVMSVARAFSKTTLWRRRSEFRRAQPPQAFPDQRRKSWISFDV